MCDRNEKIEKVTGSQDDDFVGVLATEEAAKKPAFWGRKDVSQG